MTIYFEALRYLAMTKGRILFLVAACCTLTTSCAQIERLHITINENLSSSVQLIIVESNDEYDKTSTPDLETVKKQASGCNFTVEDYLLKSGYHGFKATKKFDSNGELEFALSCMQLGNRFVIYPAQVNEKIHENEYNFQLKIIDHNLSKINEIRVTLPGDLNDSESLILQGELTRKYFNITKKKETKDTISWQIIADPKKDQNDDWLKRNPNNALLLLKTKSHKSNLQLPVWISILTLILGGGGIFSFKLSKKSSKGKGTS
jgi:hypothetical protein